MKPENALIILSKAPIPGLTKTRLCPPLTYKQAAILHYNFLKDIFYRFKNLKNIKAYISYTPKRSKKYFRDIIKTNNFILQKEHSLGNKLFEVFNIFFKKEIKKIIIIASDSPDLPVKYIEEAFCFLGRKTKAIVIGPCIDKGFYLIGLNQKIERNIFEDLDWGMQNICGSLVKIARGNGFCIKLLPAWYDVDDAQGLCRLIKKVLILPKKFLPHTSEYIVKHLL